MPEVSAVVPTAVSTVDSAKPIAPKLRIRRTHNLSEAELGNLTAIPGYGDTAGELVLRVSNLEMRADEVLVIAVPVYATGLGALAVVGEPYADREPIGALALFLG